MNLNKDYNMKKFPKTWPYLVCIIIGSILLDCTELTVTGFAFTLGGIAGVIFTTLNG